MHVHSIIISAYVTCKRFMQLQNQQTLILKDGVTRSGAAKKWGVRLLWHDA